MIITNNSERDLPDAFMRRCLFHFMEFPRFQLDVAKSNLPQAQDEITVEKIIANRLGKLHQNLPLLVKQAIGLGRTVRTGCPSGIKQPSLAEIIQCVQHCLQAYGDTPDKPLTDQTEDTIQKQIRTILLKQEVSDDLINKLYKDWFKNPA